MNFEYEMSGMGIFVPAAAATFGTESDCAYARTQPKASEFSDKCLSGLIVNQFASDQGSRRRPPTSDIQCPLYGGTNPLRPNEPKPSQYLPISAGVDFRIPLRLVFKIRIKCEELPEIAVPPFGAQAVEEQAFGTASGQAIEPPDAHRIAGRNFRRRSLCKDHRCPQERGEEVWHADEIGR